MSTTTTLHKTKEEQALAIEKFSKRLKTLQLPKLFFRKGEKHLRPATEEEKIEAMKIFKLVASVNTYPLDYSFEPNHGFGIDALLGINKDYHFNLYQDMNDSRNWVCWLESYSTPSGDFYYTVLETKNKRLTKKFVLDAYAKAVKKVSAHEKKNQKKEVLRRKVQVKINKPA